MRADSPVLRALVRFLLRLFPEDTPGVTRTEMEETLFDRFRAEGRPSLFFLLQEAWHLLRHGVHERLGGLESPQPLSGFADDLRFASRALIRNKTLIYLLDPVI